MADFSTWDRATLEQFAQEATDKLIELRKAQGEPVVKLYTSAQTIPEGYVLVPVELTDRMKQEAHYAVGEAGSYRNGILPEMYRAMLAAAPKHTNETHGESVVWEKNVYTPLCAPADAPGAAIIEHD